MFNRSRSPRISGGTFSVVHGSQHNYYAQPPRDQRRFGPGEEWKEEIYSEYQRTPRGKIKLIKTFSDAQVDPYDQAVSRVHENESAVRAKRVFHLASIVNGSQESQPSLSIKYTGRDAKKLLKADILEFSRIKDQRFPQLRSFNDSDIPMIIFHDALIPIRQFIENAQNSLEASLFISTQAQRVISDLVLSTDFRSSYPSIPWNHSNYIWIRPETGDTCLGPTGPPLTHPFVIFEPRYLGPYTTVPPLPPNAAYNDRTFFDYMLKNIASEHVIHALTNQVTYSRYHPHEFADCWNISQIWPFVQFLQQPVARFPATPWNFTFECTFEKPPERVMSDGRIRLTIVDQHITRLSFSFSFRPEGTQQSRSWLWLSQAVYVFNVLGIPREEWEGYTVLGDTSICLNLWPDDDVTRVSLDAWQLEPPRYLFILSPPRLPDTTPDAAAWLQAPAGSLYYWSLDPNGNSIIPETQRIALGLPLFHQTVDPLYHAQWKAEVYDLSRQWQEAKGFDPATTDFARSMGYPILEILPRDDYRFESHVEGNEDSNEPPVCGQMQVDECSNFEAMSDSEDPTMQLERLKWGASMDVDMEDYST